MFSVVIKQENVKMKMRAQIVIKRPISEVFNYLAEIPNDVYWRDEIILAEVTSEGQFGVGSTGYHKGKQGGRELESTWKCVAFETPLYMEWELDSGAYLGSAAYRLKSLGEDTEFILEGTVIINGFARIIAPFMQMMGNRQLQKNAENLKRILESNMI
jgi:hypothetical protein